MHCRQSCERFLAGRLLVGPRSFEYLKGEWSAIVWIVAKGVSGAYEEKGQL